MGMQTTELPTTMQGIRELLQKAKAELLASPLRNEQDEGEPIWDDDKDFLYQLWSSHRDEEVWDASPALKLALMAYAQYRAADVLDSFNEILSNVDGRKYLILFKMDDFDDECWAEWKK